MSPTKYYRYFFFAFFALFAYLSLRVIAPLADSIIMGVIVAYLFHPLYEWLNGKLKRPAISAALVCGLIAIVSVAALFVLGNAVANEAKDVYLSTKQAFTVQSVFGECLQEGPVCGLMQRIQEWVADPQIRSMIDEASHTVGSWVFATTTQILYAVPQFIVFVFVSFFISFYLFIDGKKLLERVRKSLPIRASCQDLIIKRVSTLTRAVVYGSVLVSFIQGVFGAIGFLLLGISQPLLWGAVMAVFALIPYVGTAAIWGPAALFLVASGSPFKGVLLAIYGTFVISTIDNILRPLIIGETAQVHPLMVFLGVVGGIAFIGPLGFIVGPVILAMFEALVEIYEVEKGELT